MAAVAADDAGGPGQTPEANGRLTDVTAALHVGRGRSAAHDCEWWKLRKPPSLNKFRSEESRGAESEPAQWYTVVVASWQNKPADLDSDWDGSQGSYQRARDRWRTLCGDGQRRVRERKRSAVQLEAYNDNQSLRMWSQRKAKRVAAWEADPEKATLPAMPAAEVGEETRMQGRDGRSYESMDHRPGWMVLAGKRPQYRWNLVLPATGVSV